MDTVQSDEGSSNNENDDNGDKGDKGDNGAAEDRIRSLTHAVALRDELLSIAGHELRNPMHELALHLTLAQKLAERHGATDVVQRLQRARLSLDRFVEHATVLLDATRMHTGDVRLSPSEVDLAQVVRRLVDSKTDEALFYGTSLNARTPPSLVFHCDRIAIERVLGNLILNAFKHASSRSVLVELNGVADPLGKHKRAELIVRDDGCGMSEIQWKRMFNKFDQLTRPESARAGLGLGLWIVSRLVEAHEGSIMVDSTPGAGTSFTVRLAELSGGEALR